MSKKYKRSNRVKTLMKKDPHCFYCTCLVIKYPLKNRETMPDNYATIDHIYSRYNKKKRRSIPKKREQRTVLACYKCNQIRGQIETQLFLQKNALRIFLKGQFKKIRNKLINAINIF